MWWWTLALALAGPADPVAALTEHARAWNAGDLEAFCAHYAEDAVFLSPTGLTRGRAAVLERYRKRYPDRAAMGTLRLEPLDVQTDGKLATIAARWHLDRVEGEDASGLTLVVLEQTGESWLVVQDASM